MLLLQLGLGGTATPRDGPGKHYFLPFDGFFAAFLGFLADLAIARFLLLVWNRPQQAAVIDEELGESFAANLDELTLTLRPFEGLMETLELLLRTD